MTLSIKRMILFILFVTVLFGLGFYFTEKQADRKKEEFTFLDSGWDITVNGQIYEDQDLSEFNAGIMGKGDELTLGCIIPDFSYTQPVLRLYAGYSAVEIMLDGEIVYSYGVDRYRENKLIGYGYHYYPISPRMKGNRLTIKLYVGEDNAFSRIEIPMIGQASDVYNDLLYSHRIAFGLIIFIIIFGILMLSVIQFFVKQRVRLIKLIAISVGCLLIGLLALCNLDLITYFVDDLLIKVYVEYISLYMTPVLFLLYIFDKCTLSGNKKRTFFYNLLIAMLLSFAVSAIILQLTNSMHLPALIRSCHFLFGLVMVFLFYVLFDNIIKKNSINYYIIIGITILMIFGIHDVVEYYLYRFSHEHSPFRYHNTIYIGVFVFIICMMLDFTDGILKALYENAKVDIYEKMAYVDQLSNLANRRRYELLLDELDRSDKEYAIIGFDLNYLKEVNDSLGHDEGDKYIKEFSGVLTRVFGRYGTPCRIGGDEFDVVIPDIKDVDFKALFNILEDEIIRLNNIYDEWNMSVAYGMCYSYEEGVNNARNAMSIADARMYEKKHEMKEDNASNNA